MGRLLPQSVGIVGIVRVVGKIRRVISVGSVVLNYPLYQRGDVYEETGGFSRTLQNSRKSSPKTLK